MTLRDRISAGFAAVGADIKALRQNAGVGDGGAVVQGCKPTLQGDATPHVTQTKAYQITNFNSFINSMGGDACFCTGPGSFD